MGPLLARIMPKFSTAATKSSALPVLRDPQAGTPRLLNVPDSTFAGAWGTRLRVTRLVKAGPSAASRRPGVRNAG